MLYSTAARRKKMLTREMVAEAGIKASVVYMARCELFNQVNIYFGNGPDGLFATITEGAEIIDHRTFQDVTLLLSYVKEEI